MAQQARQVLDFPNRDRTFNGLKLDPDLEARPTDMRGIREVIRSDRFRLHLELAAFLAQAEGVERHGARVVWVALVHGQAVARRYACRNLKSKAANAYHNLIRQGCFNEADNCLGWDEVAPDDHIAWLFTLMRAASQ